MPRAIDERDHRQHQHQQEQILDVGADERDLVGPQHIGAARAADDSSSW